MAAGIATELPLDSSQLSLIEDTDTAMFKELESDGQFPLSEYLAATSELQVDEMPGREEKQDEFNVSDCNDNSATLIETVAINIEDYDDDDNDYHEHEPDDDIIYDDNDLVLNPARPRKINEQRRLDDSLF